MTRLVDADGALLRRTPDGDLIPDADAEAAHDARCRDGWIGDEDAPAPCPVCRPHLVGRTPKRYASCKVRFTR